MSGSRMPMGAKIGVAVGLAGAAGALSVAVASLFFPGSAVGPSEMCAKAAACCRRMAGTSSAAPTCDGYMKQRGMAAEQVCEDAVKGYRQVGRCK